MQQRTRTKPPSKSSRKPSRPSSPASRRSAFRFDVVTLFPEMFSSLLGASILQRATAAGKIDVRFWNPRNYTKDKHRTVDDMPYGGGPGMVMKIEPLVVTLRAIPHRKQHRIIVLTPKGKRLTQQHVQHFSTTMRQLILICGRYEGIDERIMHYAHEECSVGDFVLTGGELAAMIIIDSVARLLPGVLGNAASSRDESHTIPGLVEYSHYTRPEVFESHRVPTVLLSGNHEKIAAWRKRHQKRAPRSRRHSATDS